MRNNGNYNRVVLRADADNNFIYQNIDISRRICYNCGQSDILKEAFLSYPCGTALLYGNLEAPLLIMGENMSEKISSKLILKKLLAFSMPLILSGLLQQLFNWVDALIVGNIIGETALAGVGATSSLYNLFITALVGFTSGLTVLFARQFGEGKHENNSAVLASYSIILTITFSAIAALGAVFVSPILTVMNTAEPLFRYAEDYLRIIFAGIPFLAVYNTYSAALRGMGNSRVPFAAVLISSATNAVLDLVFIALFKWGVSGAAAATVISQAAMAVFIAAYTAIKCPKLKFSPFKMKKYLSGLKGSGKFGFPPAVQSSISSVGNVILQRFMNGFGEQTVAAITTAYRVDSLLLLPIINLSTAISTLVAQEIGAGNSRTAKKVFRLGTILMSLMSLALTGIIILTGKNLLSIFGLAEETAAIGERFFRTIAVFYLIYGLSMSIKGYLEGNSDMIFSGAVGICSLGVRIVCSYAFAEVWGNMVVAYAEAFSWIFAAVVFALRYLCKTTRSRKASK